MYCFNHFFIYIVTVEVKFLKNFGVTASIDLNIKKEKKQQLKPKRLVLVKFTGDYLKVTRCKNVKYVLEKRTFI